jgi:hypothetical protein
MGVSALASNACALKEAVWDATAFLRAVRYVAVGYVTVAVPVAVGNRSKAGAVLESSTDCRELQL